MNSKMRPVWPGMFFLIFILAGCAPAFSGPVSASSQQGSAIDWVNFIHFQGITYVAASERPGRALTENDLSSVFATVQFKLEGNIQDPNYQTKDGDAAFLDAGTKVLTVKGYSPSFRLAAQTAAGRLTLYEADTNPQARNGKDLLDISGKVQKIGLISDQDGVTELATLNDTSEIANLVAMIMKSPVNQKQLPGEKRCFLAFHLADGTAVTRAYWLDTNELARGIILPPAFTQTIKAAFPQL